MEDIDILKKFANAKLIDIVKNHQRYGYDDELRDSAICLLEERGWSREDLQQFGYLTNLRKPKGSIKPIIETH